MNEGTPKAGKPVRYRGFLIVLSGNDEAGFFGRWADPFSSGGATDACDSLDHAWEMTCRAIDLLISLESERIAACFELADGGGA